MKRPVCVILDLTMYVFPAAVPGWCSKHMCRIKGSSLLSNQSRRYAHIQCSLTLVYPVSDLLSSICHRKCSSEQGNPAIEELVISTYWARGKNVHTDVFRKDNVIGLYADLTQKIISSSNRPSPPNYHLMRFLDQGMDSHRNSQKFLT